MVIQNSLHLSLINLFGREDCAARGGGQGTISGAVNVRQEEPRPLLYQASQAGPQLERYRICRHQWHRPLLHRISSHSVAFAVVGDARGRTNSDVFGWPSTGCWARGRHARMLSWNFVVTRMVRIKSNPCIIPVLEVTCQEYAEGCAAWCQSYLDVICQGYIVDWRTSNFQNWKRK